MTSEEAAKLVERLNDLMASFEDVIRRKAEDLAVPMVRDAEARARLAITDAAGETQRLRDLAEERLRRLEAADRQRDESNAVRRILAAALGEPPGALPLSYFADRVTEALTIHQCPGIGITVLPCCGRDLTDMREDIRVTSDPGKVTCQGKSGSEESGND